MIGLNVYIMHIRNRDERPGKSLADLDHKDFDPKMCRRALIRNEIE